MSQVNAARQFPPTRHAEWDSRACPHTFLTTHRMVCDTLQPHTECDHGCRDVYYLLLYFNSHTPYGVRRDGVSLPGQSGNFNPRTPYGVRRYSISLRRQHHDFNPRTPYGVRHRPVEVKGVKYGISIHAPHTECDHRMDSQLMGWLISIHAPHTECDIVYTRQYGTGPLFQSTHPIRSATTCVKAAPIWRLFQSTHPIRSATHIFCNIHHPTFISIHAPHTECDGLGLFPVSPKGYFNPRTPYGVRPRHR